MNEDILKKVAKVLSSNDYLKEFALANQMTVEAAKALLEKLMREPVVSEQAERFIFSVEASPDLKGYYAGSEKGYSQGHEAGFAKGAAIGVLGTLATVVLGGVTLYLKFKD